MSLPLLVVAAHPDDETVGATSLLLRATRSVVIHLTDGAPRDPALWGRPSRGWQEYARLRREEALEALAEAALPPERVLRLGGIDQELVEALAPMARELASVIASLEPRFVVTHPLEGGHPDHDAAALVTRAALDLVARDGVRPRLAEMTSYHLTQGRLVTGSFLPGSPRGIRHRLTGEEREIKRRMLERYASQRETLAIFGLEDESFRLAPPVSLRAPPHAPPLHYEVRGWASFGRFRDAAVAGLAELGLIEGREPQAESTDPRW